MKQTGFFGEEPQKASLKRPPAKSAPSTAAPAAPVVKTKAPAAPKEPPKSVHEVPPANPPPLGAAPVGSCCYCGAQAEGRYAAPASSTSVVSVLPLCNRCGPGAKPSLPEIWARIAEQVEEENDESP
jgi:hypothetical protein